MRRTALDFFKTVWMACISGFNMFGVYVYISAFLSF